MILQFLMSNLGDFKTKVLKCRDQINMCFDTAAETHFKKKMSLIA